MSSGSYGFVYSGAIIKTYKHVVIKFQLDKGKYKKELRALNHINNHIKESERYLFPQVYYSGKVRLNGGEEYYYIVMDKYGDVISNVAGVSNNVSAVLQLGI